MSQTGKSANSADSVRLRPAIIAAKERLAEDRQKLRRQHDAGSPGIQVCARHSDLWDGIVLDIFERAAEEIDPSVKILSHVALVPHGGYGRRDVAPFSDMDLLLLHEPSVETHVGLIAQRLIADISDVGIELGSASARHGKPCKWLGAIPSFSLPKSKRDTWRAACDCLRDSCTVSAATRAAA